jgi:transcriptional regulator with XRE-family HTH domain
VKKDRWNRVGARLCLARGHLSGLTFARELGVRHAQLQRIEAGQPPSAAFLIAYGKSGRSIAWLLFGRSSHGMLWPKHEQSRARIP